MSYSFVGQVAYASTSFVGYQRVTQEIVTYSHYLQYGGVEMVAVHRLGVDNGTFTCIEGSAQRPAWGLGGWVADRPPRCYQTIGHNRKNGGNICNASNCGISIVMRIFLFYFRY